MSEPTPQAMEAARALWSRWSLAEFGANRHPGPEREALIASAARIIDSATGLPGLVQTSEAYAALLERFMEVQRHAMRAEAARAAFKGNPNG